MKFLAKLVLVAAVGGAGTAMYAAADDTGMASRFGPQAAALREQAQADHQTVLRLKAIAVKEKDILRLNCINDKLVQMNPQLNIVDSIAARLTATEGPDADAVFKELTEAADKVREQRELASQCAEAKVIVGESTNLFEGPDVETPTDPDPGADPGGPTIEPPGYASPDR